MAKLAKLLTTFTEDVAKTVTEMTEANVESNLKYFLGILTAMEANVQHPCMEFIMCQQAISHCYGIMGNSNIVSLNPFESF